MDHACISCTDCEHRQLSILLLSYKFWVFAEKSRLEKFLFFIPSVPDAHGSLLQVSWDFSDVDSLPVQTGKGGASIGFADETEQQAPLSLVSPEPDQRVWLVDMP
ncbi:hypothetical protein CHS0354_006177 [Potamilus streckersoni]|uniref:Uncharacterized protein n=1 Tax=Potamilus streckersoni TaxID=2493646 RepID=A0AAE0TF60_9BIVA|nr:hypothetical protein CHS0354_006177 [Potamilus streckersoni]